MKLTLRELLLAWLTGVVLVFLPTWYFFAAPRLEAIRELRARQDSASADLDKERRMVEQAPAWQTRLAEALKSLTVYPDAQDVTADMLIKVEGLATQNSLTLTRREPQKERRHGDIGALDIKCNWEGTLEALVRFLFALQQDHGMLDINQLYIKSENKGVLKGTFTINCSFVRSKAKPAAGPDKTAAATNGTAAAAGP